MMWWLLLFLIVPVALAPVLYQVWREAGKPDPDDPDDLLRSGYGW